MLYIFKCSTSLTLILELTGIYMKLYSLTKGTIALGVVVTILIIISLEAFGATTCTAPKRLKRVTSPNGSVYYVCS